MFTERFWPRPTPHAIPESPMPLVVRGTSTSWALCDLAEPRLKTSLDQKTVMTIGEHNGDPILVLKMRGIMCALALQNFSVDGVNEFKQGNWYFPHRTIRPSLEKAFDANKGKVELQGTWTLLREAHPRRNQTTDDIIHHVLEQAKQIPDTYPDKYVTIGRLKLSRKMFRKFVKE